MHTHINNSVFILILMQKLCLFCSILLLANLVSILFFAAICAWLFAWVNPPLTLTNLLWKLTNLREHFMNAFHSTHKKAQKLFHHQINVDIVIAYTTHCIKWAYELDTSMPANILYGCSHVCTYPIWKTGTNWKLLHE